jgi:predicted ATPase/class 3 adenylate cyclase
MKCPNCDFENPATHRFCGNCGNIITIRCQACGGLNPLDYQYCGHCGDKLGIATNRFGRQEPSATYSYFPASSSAFVVQSPSETQPQGPKTLGMLKGERRVATVIVADVKKSTDLLEAIGSEAWVDLMSKLLQVMEAQIYRFGGQVDQFRGDGLVAFFGARDAHEDDPERAVLAALSMQAGFERYKKEFRSEDADSLKLRIGINTDELIVARVGTEGLHREDTAMGEAIALAARLESAAEPGTVLVSDGTYKLVSEKFHWIDLGKINVKGLSEPVQVYRPVALRSDAELLRDMQTYIHSSPLIGRYEEYDLVRQKVDQVLNGRGEIVAIQGERGLGKSFLVRQVHQDLVLRKQVFLSYADLREEDLAGERDVSKVLWLRGWCSSYEQSSPFFMWRILMKSWLGVDPEESEAETLSRLVTFCQDLWPEKYEDYVPIFAAMLSISTEAHEERLSTLDAQGFQGKLFYSIHEWLDALSQKSPLVVSLGSVQWANPGSIDLLREVISLAEDRPILWFIVFRPDRLSPVWHFQHYLETEYPHRLTNIHLGPFSKEESKALIEHILQPNKLDEETLDIIVQRTEGNPFFIKELVTSLLKDGILVKEEKTNKWRLTSRITASDLPESLQSLFLARIDKLSAPDRLVLQVASVVGYIFWRAVIDQIVPETIDVGESLNNLEKVDLIEERGSSVDLGTVYNFTSTLIMDVTYESILTSQRRTLHSEIGEFLEQHVISQEINPGFLARHFQQAGDLHKELLYRIKSAENSRDIFANQEAYQQYSRALEVLDRIEEETHEVSHAILTQRFELVKGRIEILYHLGRVTEAHRESRRLLEIADQLDNEPVWRIDALLMQPGVNYVENQTMLQEGIPQAEEALRLSREINDRYREMESLAAVAGHRFLMSDPEWNQIGKEAIAIAEELKDKKTEVELLLGLAGAYGMDKLDMGLKLVKKAHPIAREINYKGAQVEMLYWLGTEFERAGDYYTLLKDFEERRLQLSRELGWRLVEARSLMFVGQIKALYLGDYEDGLTHLEKAEQLWEDVDQRLFVYLRKAQTFAELRQFESASRYLEMAKPLAEGFVQSLAMVGYELVKSIHNLNIGTLDSLMRVLESTDHVLRMVEEQNLVSRQYRMAAANKAAQAQLRIARMMLDRGDDGGYTHYRAKAIDSSGLALDTFNDFGFTQVIETVSEEILYYHGLALRENQKNEEANEYMHKAHDELIRKFKMIPEGSAYRKTFMQMQLHQKILDEGKKFS